MKVYFYDIASESVIATSESSEHVHFNIIQFPSIMVMPGDLVDIDDRSYKVAFKRYKNPNMASGTVTIYLTVVP